MMVWGLSIQSVALLHLIIHEPRLRPCPHPQEVPSSVVLAVAIPAPGKEERQEKTHMTNDKSSLEKALVNSIHVQLGRLTVQTSRKRM